MVTLEAGTPFCTPTHSVNAELICSSGVAACAQTAPNSSETAAIWVELGVIFIL
jgi:hypothetical protein